MRGIETARILLTAVLSAQAILGFALDWAGNHLLNPLWHPHARFHGALLLFMLAGVSATGVWLLWRKSREPGVALKAASLIALSFWTPFLYITAVLPGATLWAGDPGAVPHLAGHVFYPNLAVAVLFIGLTFTAAVAAWRGGSQSRAEREGLAGL